jgi:hypothetical protein
MPTTTQLRDRCKTRFADTTNAVLSNQNWLDYLNDAYRWVQSELPFFEQMQTYTTMDCAAANRYLYIGTDVYNITMALDTTNDVLLEPVTDRSAHRRILTDRDEQGTPRWYKWTGPNQIELIPVPDAVYSYYFEYFDTFIDLTLAGSDPQIPSQHHGIIVEYALYLAYLDDDDVGASKPHLDAANRALVALRTDMYGANTSKNPQIVDDWF